MSVPDINALSNDLLVELAKRGASNGRPGDVREICAELRPEMDWKANPELARSAGWLLVNNAPPLAKRVMDSEKPGALFLALTAAGKSAASKIYIQQQPPTFRQKLQAVPRSDWIALAAFVVSVIALFKPGS